jgi:hypothetical protein
MALPHRSLITAITATLALLAISACGGGSSSPASQAQDVVNNFGHSGNCKLLTAAARQELGGSSTVSGCQRALNEGSKPKYTIQSTTVNGSAATVKVKGTEGVYTIDLTKASGAWLIDVVHQPGSKASASSAQGGRASSSQGAIASAQLREANTVQNLAFNQVKPRLAADIGANNLPAAKADVAQIRTTVFDLDASVRKISFPSQFTTDVNSLLTADRKTIIDLDAIGYVSATGGQQSDATFNLLMSHYNRDQATMAATDNKLLGELPK